MLGNKSLKTKLFLTLVLTTSLILIVYAWIALKDFEKDKVAYVFDSNQMQAKSLSSLIKTEVSMIVEKVQSSVNIGKKNSMDKRIQQLTIYSWNAKKSEYEPTLKMNQPDLPVEQQQRFQNFVQTKLPQTDWQDIDMGVFSLPNKTWALAIQYKKLNQNKPTVIFAQITNADFFDFFLDSNQDAFLISKNEVILKPAVPNQNLNDQEILSLSQQGQGGANALDEAFEARVRNQSWLLAKANVGFGGLAVLSAVPRSLALEGVKLLVVKSLFFLLTLFFIVVFVSIFLAKKLTTQLQKLTRAAEDISKGQFDINLQVKQKDEVGTLATSFNHMAGRIKELMSETAEKSRMEQELKTAQLLQSTLFPEKPFDDDHVAIHGYYKSASECGGDLWYYKKIGDEIYMMIGDATGHGVSAALVTSAARSASEIIETYSDIQLNEIMALLNKCIAGTTKGQILMTFFLAKFNVKTHEFTYVNASHDPPYWIPGGRELKKSDLNPLMDNNGKRLGESPDSTYEKTTIRLQTQDKVLFYTDGVPELINEAGEMWGERKFLQTVLKSVNAQQGASQVVRNLADGIDQHRQSAALKDDVTYFMFESL